MGMPVQRAGAMGVWEPWSIGWEVGIVTARWGRLGIKWWRGLVKRWTSCDLPSPRLRAGAWLWSLAERAHRRPTRNC